MNSSPFAKRKSQTRQAVSKAVSIAKDVKRGDMVSAAAKTINLAAKGVSLLKKRKRNRRKLKTVQSRTFNQAKGMEFAPNPNSLKTVGIAVPTELSLRRPVAKTFDVNGSAAIRVSGTEMIGVINILPGNTNVSDGFYYAPGMGWTPLLDATVMQYSRWHANEIILRFVPSLPTTSIGKASIYGRTDLDSPHLTSVIDISQLEHQVQASIYLPCSVRLPVNKTADGLYLPTINSSESTATLRQTYATYLGFHFGEIVSTGSITQVGHLVLDYDIVAFQQEPQVNQLNPANYQISVMVPAGSKFSEIVRPFAPNWIQSKTNPQKWKYIGPTRKYDIDILARIDDDYPVADHLPGLPFISDPSPSDFTAQSRTAGYTNDNVATIHWEAEIERNSVLEFQTTSVPADMYLTIDFSYSQPKTTANMFDF